MSTIKVHDETVFPAEAGVDFELIGVDSNAFSIIGYTTRQLRKAGNPTAVLDAYRREAMSGDYDHVIQASMAYGGDI